MGQALNHVFLLRENGENGDVDTDDYEMIGKKKLRIFSTQYRRRGFVGTLHCVRIAGRQKLMAAYADEMCTVQTSMQKNCSMPTFLTTSPIKQLSPVPVLAALQPGNYRDLTVMRGAGWKYFFPCRAYVMSLTRAWNAMSLKIYIDRAQILWRERLR